MDLVFIGVQQNGLATPARVVDRVVAGLQGWRRVHYVSDAGRFDHFQGYALVGHALMELWGRPDGSQPDCQI
jgi:hypothetical protein